MHKAAAAQLGYSHAEEAAAQIHNCEKRRFLASPEKVRVEKVRRLSAGSAIVRPRRQTASLECCWALANGFDK